MILPFEDFVEMSRADDRVYGLVLTGSRGRDALVRRGSDWDVRLIVRDGCQPGWSTPRGSTIEVAVFSLAEFEAAGTIGSESEWDRYSYVDARVVLDKLDGGIAELVREKSTLPPEAARTVAADRLDDYVNSYYRSAKNHGLGLAAEAHLDAAESISPLLTALFAFHERVRPFNKFLRWELDRRPLGTGRLSADALVPRLGSILSTGDLKEQQSLFRDVEGCAREHGHGAVIDSWEPDVLWLRGEAG